MKIILQSLLIGACFLILAIVPMYAEVDQPTAFETYQLYVEAAEERIVKDIETIVMMEMANLIMGMEYGMLSGEQLYRSLMGMFGQLMTLMEYLVTVQTQLDILE